MQCVGVYLERDRQRGPESSHIEQSALGDLGKDRYRLQSLYDALLAYAVAAMEGKAGDPTFPITAFAPATVVALFLESGKAKTFKEHFEKLDNEKRKAVLQRAMAASRITGAVFIHSICRCMTFQSPNISNVP